MGNYVMALVGFIAGVITIPIGIIVWPFFLAWFLYNEKED